MIMWKVQACFYIVVLSEFILLASSVNVVCYFSSWTIYRPGNGKYNAANLPADLCTHVLYAFVGIDYQGNLMILDDWEAEGLKELQHLQEKKNENPKLKVMVSMGGWNEGSEKYSHVVSNSTLRKNLIDSILVFLNKFKFDGFDLDWEYPNQRGGNSEDVQNLVLLLSELKEAFKPKNYTLSIAASGGVESASVSYNISALGEVVDFINVMTFDYHGNWDSYVGHSSPLYPSHLDTAKNRLLNVVLGSNKEFHFLSHAIPVARSRRSVLHTRRLKVDPLIHTAIQQPGFLRVKRGYKPLKVENLVKHIKPHNDPSDPYFPLQWYLKNTGQNGGKAKLDLNVEAAWAQGFTGKNITTAIMDDGVDYMHPDLKFNYNAKASYDFSSNDPFPYPRYTDDWFNSHGTRCAGEVAAARDNGICGVGVAYDSKIAGIRMLDQPYMTDLIEANSMGHEPNLIDIYSASWGPTDDGKTVDGPRNATMRAIVKGVNEGRNGLGNIYVWASGDGGADDDCNCDGYAASMWTISINSAINDGQNAHYDESCSSTLASTFSNGAKDPNTGVATTDLYGKCTTTHSGTSAAAPEAAGVFALALEANNELTWRDMQHLTVLTSKRNSLFDAKRRFHWTMNGVGLEFNHLFGFGVLDAGAMVALAKIWKSVPPRYHCDAGSVEGVYRIPSRKSIILKITTDACKGLSTEVKYLEHVQAVATINATRRGDLELFLTSPMGTRSMILSKRVNDDDSKDGFTKWPFMTTHTWGEYPQGTWTLEARFNSELPQVGFIKEWSLMLHGTKEPPYTELSVLDPHSKLAIVKKAHENQLKL